ncbi:hypothetical protein DSO57_1004105 [Entomophthora muscae]|uniref:Uncharacterized protein n=1 Tax=Entomophthora muscae TaxID=34485 RepID=A0ACC2TIY9_9FUNG|nr:hypothetical protein DSO57_1004105 [Entomophthora muscae]
MKLAHILWWSLPTGPVVPCPEPPNASPYSWLPESKVKEKMKPAVLTGKKVDKVSAKALMVKMPETSEKIIKCLFNVQKTVVEGLQFKSFALSALSVWVINPELYAHLKPANQARTEDTKL